MQNEVVLEENQEQAVHLSSEQLRALAAIGRKMAGRLDWWGTDSNTQIAEHLARASSVVTIKPRPDGAASVMFRNVIGSVRLGETQLQIRPKIPLSHFLYLMKQSDVAPRMDDASIQVGSSDELRQLVAKWLVVEAERILRLGLHRDYSDYEQELSEVRGSVQVVPTMLSNMMGRPVVSCEFSDLDEDASINRLVKAACLEVASCTSFDRAYRNRARRVAVAMGQVGALRLSDSGFQPTRLHARYSRVLPLAKLVIAGKGASWVGGGISGAGFLLPTPGIIESGLRNLVAGSLSEFDVRKRGLRLVEGGITLNPDVVIDDGRVVGDIKYKYFGGDWDRASLNQIVTFATGFSAKRGFVIGFRRGLAGHAPMQATVGQVQVRKFAWNASGDADPDGSAAALRQELAVWLS